MRNAPLRGLRVLVSGAGVVGPAVAYWLSHYGAETTVVEIAPKLRRTGFAVDFRGDAHFGVLARMGVLDELRAIQTHGGSVTCVDEFGTVIFQLPAELAGGDIEVLRRDLSRVLYEHSAEHVEYLFGERITALTERDDEVLVEFEHAPARTFGLVVGADGMHSGVRRLAFGPESRYVHHLGRYIAGWDLPNDLDLGPDALHYNEPGRMASASADLCDPSRAGVHTVFTSPLVEHDWHDIVWQKRFVTERLTGMRWHVPRLLAALPDVEDLYFDGINRVTMDHWTTGRIALVGDAAWGITLGGMGVGTGIVGAYVLAGELAAVGGDLAAALSAYERVMRTYAARWQRRANPSQFLAPATSTGLRLRNAMFRRELVKRGMVRIAKSYATNDDLPSYDHLCQPTAERS